MNKETTKQSDTIVREIQAMILRGELKEGSKLPPEREMTEMFNIGRPALREALKALEMLGLIEAQHGRGNFIVDKVQSSFYEPLSVSFKLNHGSNEEILEMRRCLELYAVSRATEIATPDDIRDLQKIEEQMRAAESYTEKAHYDREFHYRILAITGNLLLKSFMTNITYMMDQFFEQSVTQSLFDDDSIENIYAEHEAIITHIKGHNLNGAVASMNNHLDRIRTSSFD